MKKLFVLLVSSVLFVACGKKENSSENFSKPSDQEVMESSTPSYDPNRGEGKFENIELGATLDKTMAENGKKVSEVKCASCHKMTDEKLVGPGWKGVTERRNAAWIMNFVTNPDPMIDKDPELQAQLEICLVRMPNQGVSDEEARNIVEYMRENDGVK